MGRAIWIAAAILAAAPVAAADWERVAGNPTSAWYIDENSLRSSGHLFTVRMMLDDRQAGGSLRATNEFDCQGGRIRNIEGTVYDGPMGTGEVLFSGRFPGPWSVAEQGTVERVLLDAVCSLSSSETAEAQA